MAKKKNDLMMKTYVCAACGKGLFKPATGGVGIAERAAMDKNGTIPADFKGLGKWKCSCGGRKAQIRKDAA